MHTVVRQRQRLQTRRPERLRHKLKRATGVPFVGIAGKMQACQISQDMPHE